MSRSVFIWSLIAAFFGAFVTSLITQKPDEPFCPHQWGRWYDEYSKPDPFFGMYQRRYCDICGKFESKINK